MLPSSKSVSGYLIFLTKYKLPTFGSTVLPTEQESTKPHPYARINFIDRI